MIAYTCPLCKIVGHFNALGILPDVTMYLASEIDDAPKDWKGVTHFGDDGSVTVVINASIPFDFMPSIIAHELAHVIAGKNSDHNQDWEKAFDACMQYVADALGARRPDKIGENGEIGLGDLGEFIEVIEVVKVEQQNDDAALAEGEPDKPLTEVERLRRVLTEMHEHIANGCDVGCIEKLVTLALAEGGE